jgi:succinate dehydrogenase / fumarate reductase cytochrome b subunit
MAKPRPKHLDLIHIRLPLPGIVSIMHRMSGAALFLFLPLLLYLFQLSLGSPEAYATFTGIAANPLAKLLLIALLWGFLHHFCAGIRYLLLDLDLGVDLDKARLSSQIVLVVSIALTAIIGAKLW